MLQPPLAGQAQAMAAVISLAMQQVLAGEQATPQLQEGTTTFLLQTPSGTMGGNHKALGRGLDLLHIRVLVTVLMNLMEMVRVPVLVLGRILDHILDQDRDRVQVHFLVLGLVQGHILDQVLGQDLAAVAVLVPWKDPTSLVLNHLQAVFRPRSVKSLTTWMP